MTGDEFAEWFNQQLNKKRATLQDFFGITEDDNNETEEN